MIPRRALVVAAASDICANTANLAQPTPFVALGLIKTPFTPDPDLTLGVGMLADFDGSTPIHADSAATQLGTDPANGDQIITPKVPAGGWRWVVTGVTNLPQTIYGFCILDSAETTLLASELLDPPITLTTTTDEIVLGTDEVNLRLPISALS